MHSSVQKCLESYKTLRMGFLSWKHGIEKKYYNTPLEKIKQRDLSLNDALARHRWEDEMAGAQTVLGLSRDEVKKIDESLEK